ncbi:protochlorophyllide-dependent translocon component 52, chloroplastic-like [Alnus glutinosa]|uniref:protochlorophyllide-dependent translocon component 52, chloroplastic-like n=1 Tax=Alnus glutinosa TaxID=3517 RepID=UPI002D79B285|nr:protochlorophyllide-dependent translocon component 52, chloroplastic-like [Alnus glutinosa]
MQAHTFKKACVAAYPSTVQHDIVWFWPNTDPRYKDILVERKPPYIPQLDDPSYTKLMGNRYIPYGYEVLIENLMDPAHVPYAHTGIMKTQQPKMELRSPGSSRLIWTFPRNFGIWIDKVVPRWMFHVGQNLILDSDLYLLHIEERKIMDAGPTNWQKACFVPTKSDALVVGFRKWLNKYAGGQVDWRGKYSGALSQTPPKEQLMDRYRSHVLNCRSCNVAYKGLNVLEVVLQVVPIALIGIVAAAKQGAMSAAARTTMVSMAVICFASSRWLAHFIYKNFHFHDYNHAFR